jgi:hypothetical protein
MRHTKINYLPVDQRAHYWFGVDLGQKRDYSALAVLRRMWKMGTPEEFIASASHAYHGEWIYEVVQAERVELGTSYADIGDWLFNVVQAVDPRLKRTVVLDGTGVGAVVTDHLRRRGLRAELCPCVITGSSKPGSRTDAYATYVGKEQLLSRLAVAVENQEFWISERCREGYRLGEELKALRMEGKPPGGMGDDLAFALALAVWKGIVWK